jgi:DNA repair exonuclease SbcCD ATPase subunit
MLSMLATRVELDSFGKVKKSIDDMIAQLKLQQEEEVKKNDWCKAQLQETEMTTLKTEDHKGDLEAKQAKQISDIEGLMKDIDEAKAQIAELTVDMQRASMNKKEQNLEFQKTVSDQLVTVQILKKALDKLAEHYGLIQREKGKDEKNAGAGGVMQMIEKLIGDANQLRKDATKEEADAQAAYEAFIEDTNANIEAVQKEVSTKTKALAKVEKHKLQTEADIKDTMKELEGLSGLTGDLHKDCDYIVKNFDVRQGARAKETEALQQAKQILSGANLS